MHFLALVGVYVLGIRNCVVLFDRSSSSHNQSFFSNTLILPFLSYIEWYVNSKNKHSKCRSLLIFLPLLYKTTINKQL
jgi:hypothetical protein